MDDHEQDLAESALVQEAVKNLAEHFDAVVILCSRHARPVGEAARPTPNNLTRLLHRPARQFRRRFPAPGTPVFCQ